MLVDSVKITVKGGKGGNGAMSFRREKFVPKGGPDGGNGGRGGDVYVVGENNPYLLKKFREQPLIEAEDGTMGGSNKKTGQNGGDLIIKVPFGTRITNTKDHTFVEILNSESRFMLGRGGRGGRGNWEFRSPTHQTPRYAEKGEKGSTAEYLLELLLIADVGLIGLPNAGKSTLLNALTHSLAKVADYPFTTLEPNLGKLEDMVIADIPGLIEGAHKGKGLGFQFLRHIARTRLLVHCLSCEQEDPEKVYSVIRDELEKYSQDLVKRPELVIFTKYDILDERQLVQFKKKIKKRWGEALFVSVLDDQSIAKLKQKLISLSRPKPNSTHKKSE